MSTDNLTVGLLAAPAVTVAAHTLDVPTTMQYVMYGVATMWYALQIYDRVRQHSRDKTLDRRIDHALAPDPAVKLAKPEPVEPVKPDES
jgi:hypothetical protein